MIGQEENLDVIKRIDIIEVERLPALEVYSQYQSNTTVSNTCSSKVLTSQRKHHSKNTHCPEATKPETP